MRREWLIVLGVLLPCVVLFAVGSLWPSAQLGVVAPVLTSAASAPAADQPQRVIRVEPDAASLEEKTPPQSLAAPIEAAVKAVTPEITACFNDNGAEHLHGQIAVTIAFEPTPEGHFRNVTLETKVADPRLAACLEDVFAEVAYVPSGRETFEPAKHTFIFDAPHR